MKHRLTELAPLTDNSVLKVVGGNYHLVISGTCGELTWQQIIDKARMNFKEKHGTCLIIIEEPLEGKVYSYGNYDLKYVYEHGNTKGYA